MAYIRELKGECGIGSFCHKQAVVEVFNHKNGSLGEFCRPHGNTRLKEQQEYEHQYFNSLRAGSDLPADASQRRM